MDFFDQYKLFSRKYLFSILLILAGILCLSVAANMISTISYEKAQYFFLGAIALFLLGFVSLFFILKKKISRVITVLLSVVFLGLSTFYIILNVKTVKDRIIYLEEVKTSKELAKQGLTDIQKLQEAYERKYKKLATSFEELTKFAKYDSIRVLVRAEGDIPSEKMSVAEARSLGYRYPPATWTEEDAIKLGRIVREYSKVPVAEDLFNKSAKEKENRLYPFDINQLTVQRTIDKDSPKTFKVITNTPDSVTFVEIQSIPPYGPQEDYDIDIVYSVGSINEKGTKPNWKK
ncbi:MAG: hypothetical protein ACPGVD_09920 [Flavobacteriales bacterium]